MVPGKSFARFLMATQCNFDQIDARKARSPQPRERLIAPRRPLPRPGTPAWSPRAQVERRPMRVMRYARDLW